MPVNNTAADDDDKDHDIDDGGLDAHVEKKQAGMNTTMTILMIVRKNENINECDSNDADDVAIAANTDDT